MLQKGIHVAIVKTIVFLCSHVGIERKKTWPGTSYIYDYDSWVAEGSPNPTGSISSSSIPEIHPITILRILKDFFGLSDIHEKLEISITRGRRDNIDTIMGHSSYREREDSTMEFFNGWRYDGYSPNRSEIYGGLSVGPGHVGPASQRYLNSVGAEDLVGTPEDINNYYMRWGCEGDFVHKKNEGIGRSYTGETEWTDLGEGVRERMMSHNFSQIYRHEDIHSDNHPYLLLDNTITNLSKSEKINLISTFLNKLCEDYDGEEGNSPVDRVTWYEVSEFIKFYHDIWSKIGDTEGDEECWMEEFYFREPLTYRNHASSNIYDISGVWHSDDGGKWSENFETIMKLGINDWRNSIWKKKYDTYLQRIFEENNILLYEMIEERREQPYNAEQNGPIGRLGSYSGEILGETSSDEEVEENSSSRDKIKSIMEYLFENTEKISEGIYLELSDKLKDLHESL